MGVLDKVKQQFLSLVEGQNNSSSWIEWIHEGGKPAMTIEEKAQNAALSSATHCPMCTNLNGCQFLKSKMPAIPLHKNCHCKTKNIPAPTAIVEFDIRKFTEYVFNDDIIKNEGKKALFESWGYDIINSEWLQQEYIRQAEERYANGDYELGKLDKYGQRIKITIILPRKNGKEPVAFICGCMVYPYGKIQIATPYGGRIDG